MEGWVRAGILSIPFHRYTVQIRKPNLNVPDQTSSQPTQCACGAFRLRAVRFAMAKPHFKRTTPSHPRCPRLNSPGCEWASTNGPKRGGGRAWRFSVSSATLGQRYRKGGRAPRPCSAAFPQPRRPTSRPRRPMAWKRPRRGGVADLLAQRTPLPSWPCRRCFEPVGARMKMRSVSVAPYGSGTFQHGSVWTQCPVYALRNAFEGGRTGDPRAVHNP